MSNILIFHFKPHRTFIEVHISSFGALPATGDNRKRITKYAPGFRIKLAQCESEEFIMITVFDAFLTNIKNTFTRRHLARNL